MRARLALAAAIGAVIAARAQGPTLVPWPTPVRRSFAPIVGSLMGLTVLSLTSSRVARTVAVTAAAGGVAVRGLRPRVLRSMATQGRELDQAFAVLPSSPLVSGSVDSHVRLEELGREGARFVGTASQADEIAAVLGVGADQVRDPIRVFVGMDSGTPEQRVALAMSELRRTRAFDRDYLLIAAPAGSGYVNPTPVQIVEVLTRGDCATVAIGYGLLPSFLSLSRVPTAQRIYRQLLDDISAEMKQRQHLGESVPVIVAYGESLGARVLQGVLGARGLDHWGIARALWVGSPGGADHLHATDDAVVVDSPADLPDVLPTSARMWFLHHDADPVVRFRRDLLWGAPAWLDDPRGRNVPEQMQWQPGLTWAQVLVDTMFATKVRPGQFESFGHDYRADLGSVVAAAYGFTPSPEVQDRLEAWLRATEEARAQALGEIPPATAGDQAP